MKLIQNISRIFIGILFVFSGFVKAVDPLGGTYKFTDYFLAFHLDWLIPSATVFGVLLAALEFAIGFALLNNVLTKLVSTIMFFFMVFFTILTFALAIYNPVSDCGCFGDALILTNWQTFIKNLIIMIPGTIVFLRRKKFTSRFPKIPQLFIVVVGLILSLYVSKHAYNHLPQIDFRPYKIGTNIKLSMKENLDGAPQPKFNTSIIYEKDGKQKNFDVNNLPDSTWKWVNTINIQSNEGYQPPIHNFSLTNELKHEVTQNLLDDDRYTLMLVSYDLSNIDKDVINKIKVLNDISSSYNYQFFIATSSTPKDIYVFEKQNSLYTKFYTADPITLKTIIRSNPGLVLIKDGLILNKWHFNDFPDAEHLSEYALYKSFLDNQHFSIWMDISGSILLVILICALFEIIILKANS